MVSLYTRRLTLLTYYAQSVDKFRGKSSYSQDGALLTIPKTDRICNVLDELFTCYTPCR